MALRLEIVVNGQAPIVAGFTEEFFGLAATVSLANYPDHGSDAGINVGGMIRDVKKSISWLDQQLKVGDEIQIRIVEDIPISEPLIFKPSGPQ